ncbi:MAG: fliS [Acidobacteria bacterium]|nr:fliS [Acidobacteriota bacterium]
MRSAGDSREHCMPTHHSASRYQEVGVRTASPMELVVLLYDAAIASLQKAHEEMAARNIPGRTRCLNKATAILTELQATLNFEAGGNITLSLDRLYRYMKQQIFQANLHQDSTPLKEVVNLLSTLREAWVSSAESAARKAGQPTDAGPAALNPAPLPLSAAESISSHFSNLNVTA